jgi:hypothetical protein
MKNYLKFPLPTTATWFRLPERVKALEETGVGSQDLQSVTDQGNTTTNDVEFADGARILFDNGSRLQKGTTNSQTGGNGGISQICSIDYELKWEAGSQYVMESNGFTIREVNHTFTLTPGVNDDSTKGFVSGSRWILDNGDIYLCTDNTEGAAVWNQIAPKYKVYSALLSQRAGDSLITVSSGPLDQGVTYTVADNGSTGWNFSNVGGPVYPNVGSFVATSSSTPTSYTGSTVTYNDGAPVVTVLENTIGNIWWEYIDVGYYDCRTDGEFTPEKTVVILGSNQYIESPTDIHTADAFYQSASSIAVVSHYNYGPSDDQLSYNGPTSIEIRVYN